MTKSDSDQQGTQDSQSESSGSGSNQTGSSRPETVTVEQFQQLQNQIETLRRALQSDKDKAVKKVGERVDAIEGDLRTILQTAAREGKSATDVMADLERQEELEARQAMLEMARAFRGGQLPGQALGGSQQATGVNVTEVVQDLELDKEDVRVKEFMSRPFASQQEAYREAARLTKSLSRQPSDADQASEAAKRAAAQPKQDQLMQEYRDGSKNLYGHALIRFKADMRAKGLEIT